MLRHFSSLGLSSWVRRLLHVTQHDVEMSTLMPNEHKIPRKIEAHRAGYPRYCALLAANDDFFCFRRFLKLRARLILAKQDELAVLEKQLDQIDDDETSPLFLGARRRDKNAARDTLLLSLSARLEEYDSLLEKTNTVLKYNDALPRDVDSLRNWVENEGSISRDETEYLEHGRELLRLTAYHDSAFQQLENWVEDLLIRYHSGFRTSEHHDISTDPDVFIYSGSLISGISKALMLIIITLLLLVPVIICSVAGSVATRLLVIMISIAMYLSVLSFLTRAKMLDLFIAGATFVTILTVFVSGVNDG